MRPLQPIPRRRRRGRRPVDLGRLGDAASALLGVERQGCDGARNAAETVDQPAPGQLRCQVVFVTRRRLPERVRALYLRVAGRLRA